MTGGGPYRASGGPPAGARCPRCRAPELRADRLGRLAAMRCLACRGAWLDPDAFAELAIDPVVASGVVEAAPDAPIRYVPGTALCPVCGEPMLARLHRGAGQVLDRCTRHGVWFDPGELRAAAARLAASSPERASASTPSTAPPARASSIASDRADEEVGLIAALLDLLG